MAPAHAQSTGLTLATPALSHSLAIGNWSAASKPFDLQLKALGDGKVDTGLVSQSPLPNLTILGIDGAFNTPASGAQLQGIQLLKQQSQAVPFAQFALGMKQQQIAGPSAAQPLGAGYGNILMSANRGVPQAQLVVNKLWLDSTKSVQTWGSARTNLEAQYTLGKAPGSEATLAQYFQFGFGGAVNNDKAEVYWRRAAATGNPVSLLGLGNFLIEQNRTEEGAVQVRAAATQNFEDAVVEDFKLALSDQGQTPFAEALQRLLQIADLGGGEAQVEAGDYYAGMSPPDLPSAEKYYRMAADNAGTLPAYRAMGQGKLGILYIEHPEGGDYFNAEAAVPLLNAAADAGDANGLLGLAEYAARRESYPRAYEYASRAAELGDDNIERRASAIRGQACLADSRLHCAPVPVFFATTRIPDAHIEGGFGRAESTNNAVSVGVLFANTRLSDADFSRRDAIFQNALAVVKALTGTAPDPDAIPTDHDTAIIFPVQPAEMIKAVHNVSTARGFDRAFVFVHGFNTSFDAAGRLAAETDEHADFPALPIIISWPSRESLFQYTADLSAVTTACQPLQSAFEAVGDAFSGSHVTLMAHSMGSQLAVAMIGGCRGAGSLAWHSSEKLGNLVYAAADISQIDFNQTFATQQNAATHITLYASADDLALRTASSWAVDDALRAGQGGDNVRLLIAGLDTVDATGLASHGDLVDHGYVFSLPEVIADLNKVLEGDFTPHDRACIKAATDPRGPSYWAMIGGCA